MSDVWIQGRDGAESTPDESKTRPVQITVWNEALAELYAGAFRTGMRVEASGDLYLSERKATEAERAEGKQDYADLRCDAHRVYFDAESRRKNHYASESGRVKFK